MDNNFSVSVGAIGVPVAVTLTGSAQDVRALLTQETESGLLFTNTSANPMFLRFSSGTVSSTSYHYRLNANSQLALPIRRPVPISVIGTTNDVLLVSTVEANHVY